MRVLSTLVLLMVTALAQETPAPVITTLAPAIVTAGSPAFTLTVTGQRFMQDSRVIWQYGSANPVTLTTTFVSETRLEAAVGAGLLQQTGNVPVAVVQGTQVSNRVDFFVVAALAIETRCPIPSAISGRPYEFEFKLSGGNPDYLWTVSAGALPPGLGLNARGVLSGTAPNPGQSVFTVRVTDSQQNSASLACSMRVIAAQPGQNLFITALEPSSALANSPDTVVTIRGSGYSPGVVAVWNNSVDLPTAYNEATRITATIPARLLTSFGSFPITVRRIVLTAREFSNPENFNVIGPPQVASSCPLPDGGIGQLYSQTITATSGFPPYTFRASQGSLPPGLSLSTDGVVSGTPTLAGNYTFALEVTDSRSNSSERPCSLRVLGPLSVFPTALTFTMDASGEAPPPQYLSVVTGAPDIPFSAQIATAGGSWLQTANVSGRTPALMEFRVASLSGLPVGTYNGQITITAETAANRTVSLPVTLIVRGARLASITAQPRTVAFASPRDSTRLLTRTLTLSNPANTALIFSATSSAPWLSVTPASGSVIANTPARLRLRANPANLDPGTYRANVTIASTGLIDRLIIPVTLSIAASSELLTAIPPGITVTSVQEGPAPSPEMVYIAGQANSTFFWEAATTPDWLTIAPASDAARPDTPSAPELHVNPSGRLAGVYFGEVRVASPSSDNSPRLVSAVSQTLAPDAPLIEIKPAGLLFTSGPSRQTVTVRNLSTSPAAIDLNPSGDVRPFTVFPQGARTLQPGESRRVDIEANAQGLSSGAYRASLIVHASNNPQLHAVDLQFIVRPNLTCTPARLHPVVSAPAVPFALPAGLPLKLEVRVVDDCGTPLTSGAVSAGGAALTHIRQGLWVGSWTAPASPDPASLSVFADDPTRNLQGVVTLNGLVAPSAGIPVLNDAGTTSAASFQLGAPLAPGSLFAAFGSGLVEGGQITAPGLPWLPMLGRTSMYVGGIPSPVFFGGTQPGFSQVNGQVPYSIRPNTVQQIAAGLGTSRSQYVEAPVAAAQPAMFTFSQSGTGQGIIVDAARPTVIADAANPVARGSVVTIYVEGLGAVNQLIEAGQPAPFDPLARTTNTITVNIGGQLAEVLFTGLTPGFAGLYQINATVPAGITPGNAVPVIVTAGGLSSLPATIAVR